MAHCVCHVFGGVVAADAGGEVERFEVIEQVSKEIKAIIIIIVIK